MTIHTRIVVATPIPHFHFDVPTLAHMPCRDLCIHTPSFTLACGHMHIRLVVAASNQSRCVVPRTLKTLNVHVCVHACDYSLTTHPQDRHCRDSATQWFGTRRARADDQKKPPSTKVSACVRHLIYILYLLHVFDRWLLPFSTWRHARWFLI